MPFIAEIPREHNAETQPKTPSLTNSPNNQRLARGVRSSRDHVHPATASIEPHLPVNQGENSVVAPQPDVLAGKKLCPALADENIAGKHLLRAEFLYSEALADAVATIFDAALSFFVCHWEVEFDLGFSRRRLLRLRIQSDPGNLYPGQLPAMTDRTVITFAPAIFKREDLFAFPLLDDFADDLRA